MNKLTKTSKILILLILSLLYLYFLLNSQNSDMFFIISSGKDILNGNLYYNPHTNLPIVHQQWLYSIICYQFDKLGIVGHFLFVFLQDILLWFVSYTFIKNKAKNKWSAIIIPIISIIVCHNYMICIRPQIITMILLITELLVIEKYKETNKYLLLLIPISILEANLHQAIFLYHIFIMIPFLFDIMDNKLKIDWKLVFMIPIMILSTLITPYGINGTLFIYKTLQSNVFKNKIHILEVAPVEITSFIGIILLLMMIITGIALYKRIINKYIIFYVVSIFILTFISLRHSVLMLIPLLYLGVLFDLEHKNIKVSILGILLFFSSLFVIKKLGSNFNILTNTDDYVICKEVINEIPKDATIYNEMNIGAYLEYMGYENILFDARPELYTQPLCEKDYFNDYSIFRYGIDLLSMPVSDEIVKNIYNKYEYIITYKNSYGNKILNTDNKYKLINEENKWYNIYKRN